MYVHKEGYSFPNILYSVQRWALPRPQRLLPLILSLILAIFVSLRIVTPLVGSFFPLGLASFGVILWFGPRLVEELESACGRNPVVEVWYWLRYFLNYRRRYFIGTRRANPAERRRLAHHFGYQRTLAGGSSHRGRSGRAFAALGRLGRTVGLALARTARPGARRSKTAGNFDTRTDIRSGAQESRS